MNAGESLQNLLGGLGAKLGIQNLALDEQGMCSLVFDGRTVVNLQADSNSGTVIFFSELGGLPENAPKAVYSSLLEANLFWKGTGGATLSVEPESRTVLLHYQESLLGMDQARFEQILERFVNAVDQWGARLERIVEEIAPRNETTGSAEETSGIRV